MAEFKSDGKMIFMIFIGAIITIVFLSTIADSVFTQTNTFTNINETVTGPAVDGIVDLVGRDLVTSIGVVNGSGGEVISGGILQTGTSAGLITVQLTLNSTAANYVGQPINVSYEYNPEGYVSDSGARSVTKLIVIFGALAILIFVVVVLFQNESFKKLLGRN